MAALGPLVLDQSVQLAALKSACTAGMLGIAFLILSGVHKAAVDRLPGTSEQERACWNANVADGWLHHVRSVPDRALYVVLQELSSVLSRCGGRRDRW